MVCGEPGLGAGAQADTCQPSGDNPVLSGPTDRDWMEVTSIPCHNGAQEQTAQGAGALLSGRGAWKLPLKEDASALPHLEGSLGSLTRWENKLPALLCP